MSVLFLLWIVVFLLSRGQANIADLMNVNKMHTAMLLSEIRTYEILGVGDFISMYFKSIYSLFKSYSLAFIKK